MIGKLIMNLLQVNITTGLSANIADSSGNYQRVYHARIPQGHSFPAVVYNVLDQTPDYVKGAVKADKYPVSFSVYHKTDVEAATIATAIRSQLEGWSGTYDGNTWHYTMLERTVESYDEEMDLSIVTIDFLFSKAV